MIINNVLLVLATTTCIMTASDVVAQRLSEEGERMQVAHRFLFEQLVNEQNATFTGQDPRHLRRVVLSNPPAEVSGQSDVMLLDGAEGVLPMFRYIELSGTGLDRLGDISLLPIAPETPLPVSTHTPTVYRVKLPALGVPRSDTPPVAIRLRGTATIQSVSLVPFGGGISEEFDSAPYRNLGEESPPEHVTITIDTQHDLSIEGHQEIDRRKWFRFYGVPNSLPRAIESYAIERGFHPGRQIVKFQPALVEGYSPNQPKLREDPKRPGWADPSFFKVYKADRYADMHEAFRGTPFAMCVNDYPDFMSVPHTGRGTPKPECFDAAADLVVRYLQNEIGHSGQTAEYWELKNEATIKAEWDYHYQKDVDSWGLMSQFHNTVADAVHQHVPGIKIGGPASAWMQVQVKDFSLWRNQCRFMDETRGHLDFYSHHFYEDMGTLGAFEKRTGGYTNYLLGRLEAILDMFAAHMHETDNVRPILLTEYGALNVGKSQADYWLRLRTYNAYVTRLMQRPDQIQFAVPFIFLASPWDPQNGHAVFVPKGEGGRGDQLESYRVTPAQYFFEFWRDFGGSRLPVQTSNRWLSVVAAHHDDTIQLALSNMGGRRVLADIQSLSGTLKASAASQRRLHYRDGDVLYRDSIPVNNNEAIPIDPEETTIVTFTLDQPLDHRGQITQYRWYAAGTAIPSAENGNEFTIACDPKLPTRKAILVIGLQRSGGLTKPLAGAVNGHQFTVANDQLAGVPRLFQSIFVDIPREKIAATNLIKIHGESGLTITSVHLETQH